MSKAVAGQPENVTLLECMENGSIPYPGRMRVAVVVVRVVVVVVVRSSSSSR